jgi:hypothetical protein
MAEEDPLPTYQWPVLDRDSPYDTPTYNVIQKYENDAWQPHWIIVDPDGTTIAQVKMDEFPEDPSAVARAVVDAVCEIHNLPAEEFNRIIPLNVRFQDPPEQ